MLIIYDSNGQSCNRFHAIGKWIREGIKNGEKTIILVPDVIMEYYPKLLNSEYCCVPLFNRRINQSKYARLIYKITAKLCDNPISRCFYKIIEIISRSHIKFKKSWASTDDHKIRHYSQSEYRIIKELFTPDNTICSQIRDIESQLRENCDILVGMHIRRGDYKTWLGGKYFYSWQQYAQIAKRVSSLFPDKRVVFFIASNEPAVLTNFTEKTFVIPDSNAVKDLHMLSICDYIIGPLSTFSAWASNIGQKPLCHISDPDKCGMHLNEFAPFRKIISSNNDV